ncbi:MAG: DUF3800 domain-containing protein [Novosphingobium sp.]
MLHDIYCDESSQTRHRYMAMGGLIIPTGRVIQAEALFATLRLPELPSGELKWGSVSNGKLEAYRRMVDAFFGHDIFRGVDFHSTIIDTSQQDHQRFGGGDRDKTFNKELYQLAAKFARLYPRALFHLYPDERQTTHRPGELRDILNHGRRKNGDRRDFPYRRCHFRNSRHTPLLQIVDILLGAITYRVNGHANAIDASPAKVELSRYILTAANITNVMRDTARSGKFTVWHRQLQQTRGVPRP